MTPKRRLHYVNMYKVLGLGHDANFSELNRIYRSQVKQFHPDRMHQETAEVVARSEATLRKLNEAVRELRQYHRAEGRLPFEGVTNDSAASSTKRKKVREFDSSVSETSGPHGINRWLRIFAIILAIWSAWLIWEG